MEHRMKKIVALIFAGFLITQLLADDTPIAARSEAELESARLLITNKNYGQAIAILRTFVEDDKYDSDAWNLLGFAYRKAGLLEQSAQAYKQALNIYPDHKGAIEYQGELFVTMGNMAAANKNLSKLAKLCPDGCEEYEDLAAAIAAANY